MLSTLELQVLVECARQPWMSSIQLAASAGIRREQVGQICEQLVQHGLLQFITQSLSNLPATLFAPAEMGVTLCTQSTGTTQHQLGFTPERFWSLRAGLDVATEINTVSALTALRASPARVVWETFIQRQNQKRPLFLHGKIAFYGDDGVRVFYLLDDRGDGAVTVFNQQLRYFNQWIRRKPADFPTVLILTTRPFRAWALLALARMSAGRRESDVVVEGDTVHTADASQPKASFVATVERVKALREGLNAVSRHGSGWQVLLPNHTLMTIDPFAYPPTSIEGFQRGVHAFHEVRLHSADEIRTDNSVIYHAVSNMSTAKISRHKTAGKHQIDLLNPPDQLRGIQGIEVLNNDSYHVLSFLCRHPVCPVSTIAAFTGLQDEVIEKILVTLHASGLITPATVTRIPERMRRQLPALWMASDAGVRLRALRSGFDPDRVARRHGFFASDHARRPYHTVAAHRFFEQLRYYCRQRSRATCYLDAVPGEPNEGQVNYYDLAVYDAEMAASDMYLDNGRVRLWRPDGYGALRCGAAWTRFWLEIDGTVDVRSRASPDIWVGKMGGLCAYYRSMRWTLRYPTFPRLLIVTTDERNLPVVHDALIGSARALQIASPQVYLAHHVEIARYGAMARVWRDVTMQSEDKCYAFDNAQSPDIVQTALRRPDLIADLNHAAEIGWFGFPQTIRKSPVRHKRE